MARVRRRAVRSADAGGPAAAAAAVALAAAFAAAAAAPVAAAVAPAAAAFAAAAAAGGTKRRPAESAAGERPAKRPSTRSVTRSVAASSKGAGVAAARSGVLQPPGSIAHVLNLDVLAEVASYLAPRSLACFAQTCGPAALAAAVALKQQMDALPAAALIEEQHAETGDSAGVHALLRFAHCAARARAPIQAAAAAAAFEMDIACAQSRSALPLGALDFSIKGRLDADARLLRELEPGNRVSAASYLMASSEVGTLLFSQGASRLLRTSLSSWGGTALSDSAMNAFLRVWLRRAGLNLVAEQSHRDVRPFGDSLVAPPGALPRALQQRDTTTPIGVQIEFKLTLIETDPGFITLTPGEVAWARRALRGADVSFAQHVLIGRMHAPTHLNKLTSPAEMEEHVLRDQDARFWAVPLFNLFNDFKVANEGGKMFIHCIKELMSDDTFRVDLAAPPLVLRSKAAAVFGDPFIPRATLADHFTAKAEHLQVHFDVLLHLQASLEGLGVETKLVPHGGCASMAMNIDGDPALVRVGAAASTKVREVPALDDQGNLCNMLVATFSLVGDAPFGQTRIPLDLAGDGVQFLALQARDAAGCWSCMSLLPLDVVERLRLHADGAHPSVTIGLTPGLRPIYFHAPGSDAAHERARSVNYLVRTDPLTGVFSDPEHALQLLRALHAGEAPTTCHDGAPVAPNDEADAAARSAAKAPCVAKAKSARLARNEGRKRRGELFSSPKELAASAERSARVRAGEVRGSNYYVTEEYEEYVDRVKETIRANFEPTGSTADVVKLTDIKEVVNQAGFSFINMGELRALSKYVSAAFVGEGVGTMKKGGRHGGAYRTGLRLKEHS